ncbi:MAG TPA: lipid-A-disaccharide synthase N-terminal domain-containing protein [Cyclobacteriaceae bacterium]|nr:lipid-A-disaccharide synthase N-terminal domain-containing protein [Cyclobacteriaceae bacterium]HPW60914.1 lipid-A-disaccharide synthase N-terminal domain-containing protein [Cyclobacteriaceae bacterium]
MESLGQLTGQDLLIYGLGFFAQSLFGARTIIQWIKSEREGRVVSPTLFWIFSICGSFLFLIYGVLRNDFVILFGQTISFYIYIRNLQLKGFWTRIPLLLRSLIFPLPPLLLLWVGLFSPESFDQIFSKADFTDLFIIIGSIGQLLLNFRYLYQWYHSEKANESILPLGFWVISAFASVMVVLYGIYRHDPVLLVAQGLGLVAYLRNIYWSLVKAPKSFIQE